MRGAGQQRLLQVRRLAHQRPIRVAPEAAQAGGLHGLGGEAEGLAAGQPQKIAREQKAGDLSSSVRQQLVDPQRPGGDVEKMTRRIALAGQDVARLQCDRFRQGVQPLQIRPLHIATDAEGARAAARAAVGGLATCTSGGHRDHAHAPSYNSRGRDQSRSALTRCCTLAAEGGLGAGGRARTGKGLRPTDFKSHTPASTS